MKCNIFQNEIVQILERQNYEVRIDPRTGCEMTTVFVR